MALEPIPPKDPFDYFTSCISSIYLTENLVEEDLIVLYLGLS
jgi:hypothetical protein